MDEYREAVALAAGHIRRRIPIPPKAAIILGSGLGGFAESMAERVTIPTRDIPRYPPLSVSGHQGNLVAGRVGNIPVLAFQGRIHFYETRSLEEVLFPIRLAADLGVQILIVTNAAGAINLEFEPGNLMTIADQINLTGIASPERSDVRRPIRSMYDAGLQEILQNVAIRERVPLKRGVYGGVRGPSYETAAEIGFLRRLGVDAVGMSTVLETETAAQRGIRVLGISCITNMSTGLGGKKLDHREVTEVADRVKGAFVHVLTQFLQTANIR